MPLLELSRRRVEAERDSLPVDEIIARATRSGARPDPNLQVSDWADRYRVLTSRSSPEPGQWRTSRTPYLKAIMDALSPSSRCERVIFMAGSQVGKTETGNNWIGFNIHLAPGPMMAVQPTTEMCKRNSRQRIAPLIEDSQVLRSLVKESRSRDSGNTVLAKEFPGGLLVMVGANSGAGLRSMSARYLFLDEVDAYPGDVEGEGEPCDLAIARTTNYARRKILITSTPVVSGHSRIERFFHESDQQYYYVPCIHCHHMQTLRFEQLRWPKGHPEHAMYMCEACEEPVPNHAKKWMLEKGEWRATVEGANGKIRGFHLNSLYSPVGWLSWVQVAEKYDAAGNDREKLQVFWNTILGLPWADQGEVPEVDRLFERRELYPIGTVPKGGLVLTCGVDVQMRRLEAEIVAWGRNRESWSVDYRVFEGDTSQPDVYARLEAMLDEDFPTVYGGAARIRKLAIDTGFNTTPVYDFIRRMLPARVMGVKGNPRAPALVGVPSMIETGPQGNRLKHGVRLWPVNTNIAKEELYRYLRTSMPDLAKGEQWPTGFCHFPEYSKTYFEQLCAEQLVTRTINGLRHTRWEKIRDRNESLDCRNYARAAAASLRLDAWPATRWDETERDLTRESHAPPPAPLPPAAKPQPGESKTPPAFKAFRVDNSFLE